MELVKNSLDTECIPRTWRRKRVAVIINIGRKDTTSPNSYRPISPTSFMLKAMKKVIDNYIRTEVLEREPLHPNKCAYIMGRSTNTTQSSILKYIVDFRKADKNLTLNT